MSELFDFAADLARLQAEDLLPRDSLGNIISQQELDEARRLTDESAAHYFGVNDEPAVEPTWEVKRSCVPTRSGSDVQTVGGEKLIAWNLPHERACLIAAAPELLAACEAARLALIANQETDGAFEVTAEAIGECEAAIAKARGW